MKEIKEALEYAKLSISSFGAEVLLSEELIDGILTVFSKVEEMQKTLEWYADEKNYELNFSDEIAVMEDAGHFARQTLKGVNL